ncbi:MAG: TMEM175 family protein [Bacteroidales bacterium]
MSNNMNKNRIEAFSDGVIAIIITIMVLELHIPELKEGFTDREVWDALLSLVPKLFAYLLSFVVVAIFWINHHSLFDKIPHSTSKLIWYNTFLLFSMSLIPLPTAFLAEYPSLQQASAFYGAIMFLNAIAFYLLRHYIEFVAKLIPENKMVQKSNLITTSLYFLSIPASFVSIYLSYMIFIGIPLWYFIPDKFYKQKSEK